VAHVSGAHEISPTAQALLALEAIQNIPGITVQRLGERLGVTERAARRYVAILREAGLPIESVSGPYGGYQVGYGMRLPPLSFSVAEAVGLVMAVLEGHRAAADPLRVLDEHLSQGWKFPVDVLVDAPPEKVAWWLPRSLAVLPYAFLPRIP
jgi:biotin operon repressor